MSSSQTCLLSTLILNMQQSISQSEQQHKLPASYRTSILRYVKWVWCVSYGPIRFITHDASGPYSIQNPLILIANVKTLHCCIGKGIQTWCS